MVKNLSRAFSLRASNAAETEYPGGYSLLFYKGVPCQYLGSEI